MNTYEVDIPLDNSVPSKDRKIERTVPTQTSLPEQNAKPLKDPLIASGWEETVAILGFIMIIAIITAMGVASRVRR